MSLASALASLCILAFCSTHSFAQSSQELKAEIDQVVARHKKTGEIVGLEIGVIRKGGQPQTFACGEVFKRSGQPPSAYTLFQIGSITKTFTGVLLALFVERGIVGLEDPLQKYVPHGTHVPNLNGRQILLVHLATHTSGLPRNPPMRPRQRELSLDAMYKLLNEAKLGSEPGQQYLYSSWGSALLAEALVRVAKAEDYQVLLEQEVLAKLAMSETTIRPSGDSKVAQGYARDGYPAAWNLTTWPAFNGGGALYSSMEDMLKYLSFNLGLTQTSLNTILRVVHEPRAQGLKPSHNVGLAWEIHEYGKFKRTIIEKTGGTFGFLSYIGFVRGEPTGVVILANSVATETFQIGRQVLTLLLNDRRSSAPSP
jgi:D-alanyl-D-alanine-carboxypeptidase/D-alanyl-D-alanine-endopeptidase